MQKSTKIHEREKEKISDSSSKKHYPSSSFTRNSEGLQRFIPPLSDSPPKSKHFHSPYHLRPSIQISPQNYRSIGEISNPSIFHPSPRSIDQSLNISMRKDTSLERGASNPLVDKIALKSIVNNTPLSESYHLPLNYSSPRTQTRLPTFHSLSNVSTVRRNTSKLLTYSPKPPPLMDHESSGYIRSPPPIKEPMGSPYGFGIEAQFEKQNRVLTQILGMVAKQKEVEEEQRQKYDMREKIQELVEYDKIKTGLELEKQKSRSQLGTGTPMKLSPKKDPLNLEKVMLGLVLKKAASRLKIEDEKEEETIMEKSLPIIKEKSYQELETPKRPQISRRKRIVSPGGTIYKEMTSPLLPKSMKSLNAFEEEGSFNGGNNKSMVMPVSLSRFKSTKESSSVAKSQVINESKSIILETEQPEQEEKEEKIVVERSKRRRRTTRREKTRIEEGPVVAMSLGNLSRKQEKKTKAKKYGKLACFGWALVFGRVLFSERKKKKMEEKAKFEENISSKIGQIYELSKVWIEENAGKEILTMLKDGGQNFCIANIEGKPQIKRTEKICLTLMGHFKVIFNKLYMAMEKIPEALVEVLSPLVKDESFFQNDYFTGFEIKRMKFGPFGSIKEMSPQRVKMVIGGIIIMRVLIYNFIMRPWEVYKQQEKSKFKIDKLLNIGSILYNTMMGIFKLSVPAYEKNQSFLSEELRIKPKRSILQAIDDGGSENNIYGVEKDTSRDGEILGGFYAGHQLPGWFVENKKITEELKQLMMGWLDAIYKKVQ